LCENSTFGHRLAVPSERLLEPLPDKNSGFLQVYANHLRKTADGRSINALANNETSVDVHLPFAISSCNHEPEFVEQIKNRSTLNGNLASVLVMLM
jgi:hypothetical protein